MLRSTAPLVLALAGGLAGCLATKPLHTPSGAPEVVVRGARRPQLLELLLKEAETRGYRRVVANERLAVLERPCEDFDTAFFLGEGWNASADFRVTICLLDDESGGIHLVADVEIVTDLGTPEERRKSAPEGHDESHEVQEMLEQVEAAHALERHREAWPDELARPSSPSIWTGD